MRLLMRECYFLYAMQGQANVVQPVGMYEFSVQEQPCLTMCMETCHGSLCEVIRAGKLSEANTRPIMLQIFNAVQAIHAHNIVHRDLKPANILWKRGPNNQVFIKV